MGGPARRRAVVSRLESSPTGASVRSPKALAKDLMKADLLTVSPEASLLGIHHLYVEEEIHGAPVVDADGNVLGVVSSLDLLRAVQDVYESGATTPTYFREDLPYSGPDWIQAPEDFQDRLRELTAEDVMGSDLVTVSENDTVAEIASVMRKQRVHRVLVVEKAQLRGLVTTFDLLGILEDLS